MNWKSPSTITISEERWRCEFSSCSDVLSLIDQAATREASDRLIYFTSPAEFPDRARSILSHLSQTARVETALSILSFLTRMTLGLRSFLPRWNLANRQRHGGMALSQAKIDSIASELQQAAIQTAQQFPGAADEFLSTQRSYAAARYRAEESPDPEAGAAALIGTSVSDYINNLVAGFSRSNLLVIAEMRDDGQTDTEIGNDYAAFLDHTLYLGASFCTTNPPLVDMAWKALPEKWNPVINQIIASEPVASDEGLARLVTLEVVLESMLLLRPIYLLTDGTMGCVCLQVNPNNHGNGEAMTADALFFYEALAHRLEGGIPNVLFKLPGTNAGLQTARALTSRGIGVTITVNFGMFQHIPFALAINEGSAPYSCLVEMNGRLAFPVRDELLSKLPELQQLGITEAKVREAAAWSGVAVAKKAQRFLREHNYDTRKIRLLIASLRIYRGPGYESLPNAFPDITEVLGAGIISVFPNVRGPYDSESPIQLHPFQIDQSVPLEILDVLTHSEIFKQAYYVPDPAYQTTEDTRFKPDNGITLSDNEAVVNWPPNKQTLDQFRAAYDAFSLSLQSRRS